MESDLEIGELVEKYRAIWLKNDTLIEEYTDMIMEQRENLKGANS